MIDPIKYDNACGLGSNAHYKKFDLTGRLIKKYATFWHHHEASKYVTGNCSGYNCRREFGISA